MILRAYIFHLRARNLSPATVKATGEYLRPFIALHDPLTTTRRDIETYLGDMSERCKPSTVWTAWRHLKGFFKWLHAEGDIIGVSGDIRKYPIGNAFGVVLDIFHAWSLDDDEEMENNQTEKDI